jgi:hypothetical protein
MNLISSFLVIVIASRAVAADSVFYEHKSASVVDLAMLVESNRFDESSLIERFKSFVISIGSQHKLARLTLASSRVDLQSALNNDLPGLKVHLKVLNEGIPPADVGQVLCFDGKATAYIRRGNLVRRHQLSGDTEARKWDIEGLSLTLEGFRLRTDPRGETTGRDALPDRVWLYATSKELPNLTTAVAAYAALAKQLAMITFLIIRTDSFFFDYDGPMRDAFAVPLPKISANEFLRKPFIVCEPANKENPCVLHMTH